MPRYHYIIFYNTYVWKSIYCNETTTKIINFMYLHDYPNNNIVL